MSDDKQQTPDFEHIDYGGKDEQPEQLAADGLKQDEDE